MMPMLPRPCKAKIVATLGPASSGPDVIRALLEAGADLFRLNFSHGSHAEHAQRHAIIRELEQETGRPIGVLAAGPGEIIAIAAGMPFGVAGTTNLLRIERLSTSQP
jgi:pyruvate kinase